MTNVIGYTCDSEGVTNSLEQSCGVHGEGDAIQTMLGFLVESQPGALRVFANLDNDVACLLRHLSLTERELENLLRRKQLYLPPFTIKYIPGRWFSVREGFGVASHFASYTDVSQYDDKIVTATKAAEVGQSVLDTLGELGLHPESLISPINAFRKEKMAGLPLPPALSLPEPVLEVSYECCKGNWVEAFKVGRWKQAYDYDLNGAYPYQATKLLDLRYGKWKQSNDYQADATYGYCRCEVMIDKDFSPIILQMQDRNYTPKGVFQTSLTKNEIELVNNELGYVTILDGWWWYPNGSQPRYHLAKPIMELNEIKQTSTGLKREVVKRIMNGLYGLLLETRGEDFGEFFYPAWAAEIEANTRLELYKVCRDNHISPIHIAVDGLLVDRELDLPLTDAIGGWKLSHTGSVIVASSGVVAVENKQPFGDFSTDYEWLTEKISARPDVTVYQKTKPTVLTLAHAANMGRIKDVGINETISKSFDIGDMKRRYPRKPKTWGSLAKRSWESHAWDAEVLEVLESL